MAEDFINEIYAKSAIHHGLQYFVQMCEYRDEVFAVRAWNGIDYLIKSIYEDMKSFSPSLALRWSNAIMNVVNHGTDLVYWKDVAINEIIPLAYEYTSQLADIDVAEGNYHIKSSKSGFLSLGDAETGRFFNSLVNPMEEAKKHAEYLYNEKMDDFYLMGADMGYLAYRIWLKSHGSCTIHIYENDPVQVEFARAYGVLDWIDEAKLDIQLIEDPEKLIYKFFEDTNDRHTNCIYMQTSKKYAFRGMMNGEIDLLFTKEETVNRYRDLWAINLRLNKRKTDRYADELKDAGYHREWVVVAAGPSLNDNIEFLRESQGKRNIVIVNTVLRRMKTENIKPDFVTAMDPNDALYNHIDGCEDFSNDIPLLIDPLTSWKYVDAYRGPVYLAPCSPMSEIVEECVDRGYGLWDADGTVTSLALETALRFGAEKIYLVGCDLGYPGNLSYASGVSQVSCSVKKAESEVRSNAGGMVGTSEVFKSFISSLELQISKHPDVEIINKSAGGAYIRGTMIGQWYEDFDVKQGNLAENITKVAETDFLVWQEKYYLLRQIADSAAEKGEMLSGEVKAAADKLFENIYADFARDFNEIFVCDENSVASSGMTFVMFSGGKPDEKQNLKLWEKLSRVDNAKTLIVDSEEKYGGQYVHTKAPIRGKYPEERENEEAISIYGKKYAYYQFHNGMPNHEFYAEFMEFFIRNLPGKIYASDRYSILAKLVSELVPVEYV